MIRMFKVRDFGFEMIDKQAQSLKHASIRRMTVG
jgi:hypothetical protein